MNRNNTQHDEEQIKQEDLGDLESEEPKHIARDRFINRMDKMRKLRHIGDLSGKMRAETIADLINKSVHYQTVTEGIYDEENKVLVIPNIGADAVKPAHVLENMNVENWNGVQSVGERNDHIFIFFW